MLGIVLMSFHGGTLIFYTGFCLEEGVGVWDICPYSKHPNSCTESLACPGGGGDLLLGRRAFSFTAFLFRYSLGAGKLNEVRVRCSADQNLMLLPFALWGVQQHSFFLLDTSCTTFYQL
jgi:hypothetical protein